MIKRTSNICSESGVQTIDEGGAFSGFKRDALMEDTVEVS
jgi:hypothetical protein